MTDNDNYKKEIVDKMTVSIGSNAEPNDSLNNTPLYSDPEGLLPKWIEEGDIPNIFNGEKYPWMKPRPVVEMTRDELMNTKSYIEAMKKGLHRSGINTE